MARAVINSPKKQYGRIYPTADYWSYDQERYTTREEAQAWRDRLCAALEANGYECGSLDGARLSKIEYGFNYLMPYLDQGLGVYEADDHYVISDDQPHQDNTDGTYTDNSDDEDDDDDSYTCDNCNDHTGDTDTVYVSRYRTEEWCSMCSENRAFYCEVSEQTVSERHFTLESYMGISICAHELADADASTVYCERSESWWPDIMTVEIDGLPVANEAVYLWMEA